MTNIVDGGPFGKARCGPCLRKRRHNVLDGAAAGVLSRCVGKAKLVDSEGNALGHLCLRASAPVVGVAWGIMFHERN